METVDSAVAGLVVNNYTNPTWGKALSDTVCFFGVNPH